MLIQALAHGPAFPAVAARRFRVRSTSRSLDPCWRESRRTSSGRESGGTIGRRESWRAGRGWIQSLPNHHNPGTARRHSSSNGDPSMYHTTPQPAPSPPSSAYSTRGGARLSAAGCGHPAYRQAPPNLGPRRMFHHHPMNAGRLSHKCFVYVPSLRADVWVREPAQNRFGTIASANAPLKAGPRIRIRHRAAGSARMGRYIDVTRSVLRILQR